MYRTQGRPLEGGKGAWLWLNRQCRETTDRAGGQQALEVVLIGCNQSMLGFSSRQGADLLATSLLAVGMSGLGLAGSAGWLAQIAGCGRILAQSIVELQQLHPMQCRIGLVWQITSAREFSSQLGSNPGQQKASKTDVVGVKVEPKAMSYCRGGYGREFELLVAWSCI